MNTGSPADDVHHASMSESENEQSRNGQQPSDTTDAYIIPWLMTILPLRGFFDYFPVYTPRKADYRIPLFTHELGWSFHRFINNLLYYQTNYFVFFAAVSLYIGYVDPLATIGGTIFLCAIGFLTLSCMNYLSLIPKSKDAAQYRNQSPEEITSEHTTITYSLMLGLLVLAGVFINAFMEFVISGLLFAFFSIVLHAAVRRRNVDTELFETLGVKELMKTPMATLLEGFGVIKFTYKQ